MEAYATVEQYIARYGEVDDVDLLTEVLMDATRLIAAELTRANVPITDDEDAADRRMQVCRSITYRTIGQSGDADAPFGATQFSQSVGGYSESFSLGNPYRDLFLTKAEKRLLGIGSSHFCFLAPAGLDDEVANDTQ